MSIIESSFMLSDTDGDTKNSYSLSLIFQLLTVLNFVNTTIKGYEARDRPVSFVNLIISHYLVGNGQ